MFVGSVLVARAVDKKIHATVSSCVIKLCITAAGLISGRPCQGWFCFLPVPADGRELSLQRLPRLRESPGRWLKITCLDKLSKRRAKNETSSASAGSPIDFVLRAGFVRVPQNLINEYKFKSIDVGDDYEAVRAAEGH